MIMSKLNLWFVISSNHTRPSHDKAFRVVSEKPPVSETLYAVIKSITKFSCFPEFGGIKEPVLLPIQYRIAKPG